MSESLIRPGIQIKVTGTLVITEVIEPEKPPVVDLKALPLVGAADLKPLGAFRLPSGKIGESVFDYGGTAPAFNPSKGSLLIVGHQWDQAVGEIAIPEKLSQSTELEDLAFAEVIQPLVKVLPRVPKQTVTGNVRIGGLLIDEEKLIGSAWVYYDNSGTAESHFRLDSLNLAEAAASGFFQVGTAGGGLVGGYMTAIPPEWQTALGAPYLTGQAAIPIISRSSSGPCAWGFDPKDLGDQPAPVVPLVYYPLNHPLGVYDSTNPYFNGTTEIAGVVFVPGTRSVLFFGSHGTGEYTYGEASEANDPYRTSKGPHAKNGQYAYQVWAYDALEFLEVKAGKKQPWDLKPTALWNFDFPITNGQKEIVGVAFDPQRRHIYLCQGGADAKGYSNRPLIQVLEVAANPGRTV